MNSKRSFILLVVLSCFAVCHAIDYCGVQIDPYGFVSGDLYYDTRQVLAARDNFAILWPKRVLLDRFNTDINEHGSWNVTAIHTRFGIVGTWNGSTPKSVLKGVVEGDFLGATEC